MITGFNHTSFTVPDIERAVEFWRNALGFDFSRHALGFESPPIAERSGAWVEKVTGVPGASIRVVHLFGYNHHMEFIEYAGGSDALASAMPDHPGTAHVCLEVEDIDATFAELLAAGATVLGEMADVHYSGREPFRAGYLRDPNGIIIELLEEGVTS